MEISAPFNVSKEMKYAGSKTSPIIPPVTTIAANTHKQIRTRIDGPFSFVV